MAKSRAWGKIKKDSKEKIARFRKRRRALSRPITLEQVADFSSKLKHVDYGSAGGCWIFTLKSVAGANKTYARMSHNGVPIGPHRFALAVKLGCTVYDLTGYDAAHASKVICLGGRCCHPDHLTRKLSEQNRSWDRAKEAGSFGDKATTRTPQEARKLLDAMYPTGLAANSPLFDEPWNSNVSSALVSVLEMGLREDFRNMRRMRIGGAHGGQ